jgi:acyl-CoA reductase-like NAD-dependent aldehyde dehydrogenase
MATVELDPQQLLIGGEWVPASSGRAWDSSGPVEGIGATPVAAAGPDDVKRAAEAAQAAFPAWSNTPPGQRRALLNRAADLLQERSEQIAALVAEETGGTFGWGMFNCGLAAGMLREAAAQAYGLIGEVIPSDVPGLLALGVRQPVGVVAGIAPWNAPVILGTRAIATPLAFGNTVILKASEECPRTHAAIVAAVKDAGVPDGVVNLIVNDPADAAEVVEALIAHPAVRRINFTGSTKVGRIIAEKAGAHLKRVLLELGGKAPMVVLDDADLDAAVAAANFGAFFHQGQICMSTERIVADRSIAGDFSDRLAQRAGALVVGDPRKPDTQIGPVVNEGALRRISELVEDARGKGADVLTGGEHDGLIYRPTVLAGVTPDMRIYGEESFGPVVSIVPVDGIDEAVRVANDTEYGLSAAVFGQDVPRAFDVARRIESGICHVNGATVHDEPQMPFGGVKASGFGRFGGRAAVDEFSELRWITVGGPEGRHYPI